MKKQYGAPKAEKMEFNYSEAVVASGTHCDWGTYSTQGESGCTSTEVSSAQLNVNS